METITSRTNALIKSAAALKKTAERKRTGLFLLEGARLCADAAENNAEIVQFFVTEEAANKYPKEYRLLCERAKSVRRINEGVANKLSDTKNSQSFFCVCRKNSVEHKINRLGMYVFTDNIQNPDNLGAMARTAEALGADGVIVNSGCDIYSPKVLRSSMGALLRFPIIKTEDGAEFLKGCISHNMRVFAAIVSSAHSLASADKKGGVILVIGNEGAGISGEILKLSTDKITIPMKGKAESLNAAAAAAILIWEFMRER